MIAGAIVVLAARLVFLQTRFATPLEASFGRALLGFNPFLHQPPPPSYPLYVALGKLLNFFIHDPLVSLLTLSILGSLATFLFFGLRRQSRRFLEIIAGIGLALVPLTTKPTPDTVAVAFVAGALYAYSRGNKFWFGIAAAAAIGCVPQLIVFAPLALIIERRWFLVMLFAEFLQVMQNIELRRLRAFISANIDLTRIFDPMATRVAAAAILLFAIYHWKRAEADDLARHPDVQRGGEH